MLVLTFKMNHIYQIIILDKNHFLLFYNLILYIFHLYFYDYSFLRLQIVQMLIGQTNKTRRKEEE